MAKTPDDTKLSPVFWEQMIGMTPDALQTTLDEGLSKDPVWMIDQAICAAKNVRLLSKESDILSAFCLANYQIVAQKDLSQGICAAITGLDAIADNEAALNKAGEDIVSIFEKMVRFNAPKALETAAATKSSLGKAHPLYGALTEFALMHLDDEDYDMFKHIAHNASTMSEKGREQFIGRLEDLAHEVGYGITYVLQDFLIDCSDMPSDPAVTRAHALLQSFEGGLPMKVLYSAQPKPKKYDVKGDVITLHPRRDPQ